MFFNYFLNNSKDIITKIDNWLFSKLLLFIAWIIIYISPLIPFMIIVTCFVIIDYFVGIQAAKKQEIPITSRRRKDSITKTLGYQATLMTAYLVERTFLPMFPVLKLMAGFIAYVEVTSIDEKVKVLTGKSFLKQITKRFPKFNSN